MMGSNTKIDWCDSTWSPVTGCRNGCDYCYARKIANRFGAHWTTEDPNELHVLDVEQLVMPRIDTVRKTPYPFDFEPTFHRYRLDEPSRWTKPRTIFVCSMADLFGAWVPDEWIAEVFAACLRAPQHRYLFLTKNPQRYLDLDRAGKLPTFDNMWYGTTITGPHQPFYWSNEQNTFLSIEPLQHRFIPKESVELMTVKWVIAGSETGNRKGKVVPPRAWIDDLRLACKLFKRPLFMKDSLDAETYGTPSKEYPWGKK